MAYLNRTQVTEIVMEALRSVSDFSREIDQFKFEHFQDHHKKIFLEGLKRILNSKPYYYESGETTTSKYYDVPLSMGKMDQWNTVGDCIEYVLNKHYDKVK